MRPKIAPQTLSPLLADAVGEASRIRTRAIDLAAYASDASHYLLTPTAVIIAQTADEVARILSAASRSASPVTLRSGGTSLSGQASGAGVLVDVRQRFRGIEVLDEGTRVRVQPGATVAQVNARLLRYGYRLGPDPASEIACTIGGVVANNSSGMACGVKENTYQTLESMVFVLPSGTIINTAEPDANTHLRESEPELFSGLERLRRRVLAQPGSVALIRRQFTLKNTMGYGINAFLDYQSPVDMLQHLIIGSEGTLAFVAEVTFRTVPVLPLVSTALAVFPTLDAATLALPMLVGSGAATLELMDSTSISVGQRLPDAPQQIRGFIPENHAALLVEYRSDNAEKLIAAALAGSQLFAGLPLASAAEFHTDAAERRRLWSFRKGLYTSVAEARPSGTTALLEDIAVPLVALSDVSTGLQGLFERYGYRNSVIFGHAKDGNIHFMLTDRFEGEAALNRYLSFTEAMVELVLSAGGNLKAEHGTGRVMAPYVRRQYGNELYEVMCDLKRLCDPAGIMNPGVLIAEDHDAHIRNIKLHPTVETEVDRCVDCGYCEPVCPSRDLTLTPRQRIGVRRATESARNAGDIELARELAEDFDYDGVQTCAVDGMCQTACPVLINTGDLVRRLRRESAEPVAATGWRAAATAWGLVTRIGSKALSVAHSLPTPAVRAVTDIGRAVLGPETMPRYSGDLPGGGRSRAGFGRLVGSGENDPVGVYVPACVNSMFGAAGDGEGVTSAFVRLLEQAQIRLVIPDGIEALCCGTPWSSKGFSAGDEIVRRRSLESIGAALADSHYLVVSDASSCTEGFARILAGAGAVIEDAVVFADREIVPRLTVENRLQTLVLHPTCSSRQMGLDPALEAIGAVLAEDVRVPDNWGCCAFAGDRGMLHPELTASATSAEAAEVATIDADGYASCNRTCELGMTRATGKEYRHVLELLADMSRPTKT